MRSAVIVTAVPMAGQWAPPTCGRPPFFSLGTPNCCNLAPTWARLHRFRLPKKHSRPRVHIRRDFGPSQEGGPAITTAFELRFPRPRRMGRMLRQPVYPKHLELLKSVLAWACTGWK